MSNVTYQIRTTSGTPVFSFSSLERAKTELARYEKRVGIKYSLVEITQVERKII